MLEASELKIDESVMTGEPDHIHIDIFEKGKYYIIGIYLIFLNIIVLFYYNFFRDKI